MAITPPTSSPATSIPNADTDVDDETLVVEYDTESRLGQEIFSALDSGGLEDIGENEDGDIEEENRDLSSDGESECLLQDLQT